jgi:hypothetical protein
MARIPEEDTSHRIGRPYREEPSVTELKPDTVVASERLGVNA